MTECVIDHLMLRKEFNSKTKPEYRETHTPQCKKCMRFAPWGNGIMEMHHVKALIDGGTNDDNNLVTLCHDCHEEWHKREEDISFDEWMQKVPLHVYAAIGLVSDQQTKNTLFCKVDEMWPAIRDRRMVTEPWTDKNKKYVRENSGKWIDW